MFLAMCSTLVQVKQQKYFDSICHFNRTISKNWLFGRPVIILKSHCQLGFEKNFGKYST
jgi:hypothetical protein